MKRHWQIEMAAPAAQSLSDKWLLLRGANRAELAQTPQGRNSCDY